MATKYAAAKQEKKRYQRLSAFHPEISERNTTSMTRGKINRFTRNRFRKIRLHSKVIDHCRTKKNKSNDRNKYEEKKT